MDRERDWIPFVSALGAVSVAFSRALDDKTTDLYWKALEEVPFSLIARAQQQIVKFEDRWPTPARWRVIVDEVQEGLAELEAKQLAQAQQRLLPAPVFDDVTKTWVETFHCFQCRDTGFRPGCGCAADQIVTLIDLNHAENLHGLGRCKFHGGVEKHGQEYAQPVMPCECRATNPVWQKKYPTAKPQYSKPSRPQKRRARDDS